MTNAQFAAAALAIPFAGVVLMVLARRRPDVREAMAFGAAAMLFFVVVSLAPAILAGERPSITLFEMLPGFLSCLPAGRDYLGRYRNLDTTSVATMIPLVKGLEPAF